ncbi:uncharacterized protein isoform X1 [Castor canadensis]|uniref:Uncharacterized protein isoform X1 n=1 Tax=Castor canadensis TaxID=51338 RepID=A0AC58LQB9_CASCN
MDWGTVITGTCVSPDSSNWPQGMLHRKRRSSFPLQRFVIVRRLLFRSRRRRPGAPTMHLKWVAAPRHWMRDKLTDVFMSSVLKKTGEHVCLFGDSKGHFCSSPHRSTRGKGGCFWTDCSSCSPLQDSMLQNRRRLQSWNEVDVVSLRGHGGWSAGFQSHERAFSCTSIGKEDLEDCGSRAAVAKVNSCLRILSQECLSEVLPEVAYHFISFSLFSTTQRQHEVFPGVAYHFLSVSLYLTSR